jgi:hypothetical protein
MSHPSRVVGAQLAATLVGGGGPALCYDAHPDQAGATIAAQGHVLDGQLAVVMEQ